MAILTSRVNGLRVGLTSDTQGVSKYYNNGENNQYVWGRKRSNRIMKDSEEMVEVSSGVEVADGAVPAPTPVKAKRGRSNKSKQAATVVEEAAPTEEGQQPELNAVIAEGLA